MGWWLVVIAVGAPAIGTFAMVSPLAITSDGIRQASRSVVRKGDSIPTSQRSKEQGERFDTSLFIPKKKTEAVVRNPRPVSHPKILKFGM
jgi:hypothetical protein